MGWLRCGAMNAQQRRKGDMSDEPMIYGKASDMEKEIEKVIRLAVQNERERIYGLLLMHPWRGPDAEEESREDRAIKADRFDLMTLVRMGAEAGDVDALKVAAITWGKA